MFHFSRRTLWLIIIVTIPLIVVLNRVGQDETVDSGVPESRTWSLDELAIERDDQSPGRKLWTVDLDQARQLRLTITQEQIPTEQLGIAVDAAMGTSRQGGQFQVTVVNPADTSALEASVDFLQTWLPDGDNRAVVLSGKLDGERIAIAERLLEPLQGSGMTNQVAPQPSLGRLNSPPMGTSEQLAFLLWVGVLQQRLSGYDPQVRWDHRANISQVLINQTLNPGLFQPVTAEELEPLRVAYAASAAQRSRSAEQIHRYLVTSAVYDLPSDFLVSQQQRLSAITLSDVNAARANSRP
ncbi:hypothetical protein [Saccharospirillum impatiens]|uniref:hypothetical protein n=1 Tax=Saccharospirillum impatiens TaxID=169438 RepID=UPI0003FF3DA7|nr:hypothetical protein [Saccharospirillum impatiens]